MAYRCVNATRRVMAMRKRIRAIAGGTSAAKTVSVLLILIDKAQCDLSPTLTSVVSESIPHLKAGAMRDFKLIMQSHGYWKEDRWNTTDRIYTFETGSQIEFFSSDNGQKCHGPRRDRLFVNEANHVPYTAFDQLEVRTREVVYIDWNPESEFWAYTELIGKRDDVEFITLTYLDNEALDRSIVESIERRKDNARWWQVYGLGQLGTAEGVIFPNLIIVPELPQEARKVRRGIDFGWNDPTSVVDIYRYNGGYLIDQLLYGPGMTNQTIADACKASGNDVLTMCDSAEPKSIDELVRLGVNAAPAAKGSGSVLSGIRSMQGLTLYVTARSVAIIKDFRNYMWAVGKDGKPLEEPDHEFSHGPDSVRYALDGLLETDGAHRRKVTPTHSGRLTRYG